MRESTDYNVGQSVPSARHYKSNNDVNVLLLYGTLVELFIDVYYCHHTQNFVYCGDYRYLQNTVVGEDYIGLRKLSLAEALPYELFRASKLLSQ
ncbi:uncharacterized protein LOC144440356 isoform X2 [Glandiceps talaboti]